MKDPILNPKYLAYKFNFDHETVEFLRVETEELHKLSFLRRDAFESTRESLAIPITKVMEVLSDNLVLDSPPNFIFHTAFCGSTFLSRCLDVDGISLCLREPQILLDAANAKRLGWESRSSNINHTHLPKLALFLLQKHAKNETGRDKKLLIKPINSINNIIPELLEASPKSQSLMVYTDARNFLLSTMRKGEAAKQTVRSMFDLIRCDFPHLVNLSLSNAIHMSDIKLILTFWRLQIEQANQAVSSFGSDEKFTSLYGGSLVENLPITITKANKFFGLGLTDDQISNIINGEARQLDAKDKDKKFSVELRDQRYLEIEQFFGSDLINAYQWLTKHNPSITLRPQFPYSLVSQ